MYMHSTCIHSTCKSCVHVPMHTCTRYMFNTLNTATANFVGCHGNMTANLIRLYFYFMVACIGSCLLHGCETWAKRAKLLSFEVVDVWCFLKRQSRTELRRRLRVKASGDVMRRCRLGWHGHVESKEGAD